MAHNINFNEQTGKHSFFSVQQKAWHGLGTIVQDYPTSREAMEFAGLDFTVEKRKLFTYDNENNSGTTDIVIPEVEVPNYYATVRRDTDTVLGVVGKDYEVVQNRDAFTFFDAIVGGGHGIQYETAGALGRGERIFITAKLPSYIKVGREDLIEQYLFLTTSHNGLGSITAAFTPVRIVCYNTLSMALQSKSNAIKIRHTVSAGDRLKQAHTLMAISYTLGSELENLFNRWARIRITDGEVKKLIAMAMTPNKEVMKKLSEDNREGLSAVYLNTVDKAFEYAMTNPSQTMETTAGTLFGAYNAVTGYFQNVRSYKNSEAKFKSIFEGAASQKAKAAFELCWSFALHGSDSLAIHIN